MLTESPAERERNAWLANISELTSVITHEFNNILNGMLLHIAVLKQEVPPEILPELEVIRGLGNNAAALIKRLQQYNSKHREPLAPVDLNEIVREETAQRAAEPKLHVELADDLPQVQGKSSELRRLLGLLLDQSAAAMAPAGGAITIRTRQEGKRVLLRVEDAGPPVPAADLSRLFEPFQVVRPGGEEATLAVCHTLARHLQGSLRAENLTPTGMAFTVELSPVKE
jgi:two-component system, NtrC family, sensor kinase